MNTLCPIYSLPFYERLKETLSKIGLARYSNKFSNHVFTQHKLFYFLILKERTKNSYRGVIRLVTETGVWRSIGLRKVPHYTTLQKFSERVGFELLHDLISELSVIKSITVIGDGTGYNVTNPSQHYMSVIRKHTGKHYQIKSPVNIVLLADLKSKSILRVNASPTKTHEAKLSQSIIEELNCKIFIYDKALDSKKVRETLIKQGITPVIPYRKNNRHPKPINQTIYNQRNNAESIISNLKRVYGNTINNRKPANQIRQALIKIINYNITIQNRQENTTIKLTIINLKIKGFYRATFLENHINSKVKSNDLMLNSALELVSDYLPWANNSLDYFINEMKDLYNESMIKPENFKLNRERFSELSSYFNLIIDYMTDYLLNQPIKEMSLGISYRLLMLEHDKIIDELETADLIGVASDYSINELGDSLAMIDETIINELTQVSEYNQLIKSYDNLSLINEFVIGLIIEHELYEVFDFFNIN